MIARSFESNIPHSDLDQHLVHFSLKPAPLVAHGHILVLWIAIECIERHSRTDFLIVIHRMGNITKYLLHAWQFEDQLTTRLENPLPFQKNVFNLPVIEVLDQMNGRNSVSRIRLNR